MPSRAARSRVPRSQRLRRRRFAPPRRLVPRVSSLSLSFSPSWSGECSRGLGCAGPGFSATDPHSGTRVGLTAAALRLPWPLARPAPSALAAPPHQCPAHFRVTVLRLVCIPLFVPATLLSALSAFSACPAQPECQNRLAARVRRGLTPAGHSPLANRPDSAASSRRSVRTALTRRRPARVRRHAPPPTVGRAGSFTDSADCSHDCKTRHMAEPDDVNVGGGMRLDIDRLLSENGKMIEELKNRTHDALSKDPASYDDIFLLRYVLSYMKRGGLDAAEVAIRKTIIWRTENSALLEKVVSTGKAPHEDIILKFNTCGFVCNLGGYEPLWVVRTGHCNQRGLMSTLSIDQVGDWLHYSKEVFWRMCDERTRKTRKLIKATKSFRTEFSRC